MFITAVSPRSTGKTTVIWWLLHALHERGYDVKGFDADESKQLYRWWQASDQEFEVSRLADTRFHEEAPGTLPEGHVGAVDCGHLENHAGIGYSVLRVADLVIVVCAATNGDVERLEELPMDGFLDLAWAKKKDPAAPRAKEWVLLVRVQPGTRTAPEGIRKMLVDSGWNVFTTMIPAIQRYASTGEGQPVEAAGSHFDELVTEMEQRGLISK
ncbi:plasmid partition protein [Streptomyces laurentii]|uniref:plasmid partition protein n=1 Tax=Streptomyces laurentii TaxID=39478 RepID=UPI0036753FBA